LGDIISQDGQGVVKDLSPKISPQKGVLSGRGHLWPHGQGGFPKFPHRGKPGFYTTKARNLCAAVPNNLRKSLLKSPQGGVFSPSVGFMCPRHPLLFFWGDSTRVFLGTQYTLLTTGVGFRHPVGSIIKGVLLLPQE